VQEKCEDSTGDHIVELKDCKNCYQTFRSRDCINVTDADGNNDLLDCYHTGWSEMIYEGYSPVRLRNSAFEVQCWDGNDIFYSDTCQNCSYCFGCISLRQNKYCILNKQYSKEEYEVMLYKIINHMKSTGEWGKFFPNEICIFSYNDSVAQDVYPLEKEEAIKRGWKWQDNLPFTMGKETTTWNSYEMKIEKVQEDILNEIFACECCKKNYRIIRSELKFYKQMKLPLSRLCSGCRHLERIKTRNPRNLHNRTCNKCNKEIQTTFAPERPEKVYCEECYLKEVY